MGLGQPKGHVGCQTASGDSAGNVPTFCPPTPTTAEVDAPEMNGCHRTLAWTVGDQPSPTRPPRTISKTNRVLLRTIGCSAAAPAGRSRGTKWVPQLLRPIHWAVARLPWVVRRGGKVCSNFPGQTHKQRPFLWPATEPTDPGAAWMCGHLNTTHSVLLPTNPMVCPREWGWAHPEVLLQI